jgi:hypothetical protein
VGGSSRSQRDWSRAPSRTLPRRHIATGVLSYRVPLAVLISPKCCPSTTVRLPRLILLSDFEIRFTTRRAGNGNCRHRPRHDPPPSTADASAKARSKPDGGGEMSGDGSRLRPRACAMLLPMPRPVLNFLAWVLWLPRWSAAPNWLPAPAGYSFLVVVLGPGSLASVRLNRLARLSQASAAVMSRRRCC